MCHLHLASIHIKVVSTVVPIAMPAIVTNIGVITWARILKVGFWSRKMRQNYCGKHFNRPSWKPAPIMLSGNTDCYQPIEKKLFITRQLLEVFLQYKNPVGLITKNALVLRDVDLLKALAEQQLVKVAMSINTTDDVLRRKLEPRTSTVKNRFNALKN